MTADWKDTAVLVLYDDSDDWYDHVMSPIVNQSTTPADTLTGPGACGDGSSALPGMGQGVLVEWANELPAQHFLPIDRSIHGAGARTPEVRTVIHLHGGKVPAASDGYPEDWYLPGKIRYVLLPE